MLLKIIYLILDSKKEEKYRSNCFAVSSPNVSLKIKILVSKVYWWYFFVVLSNSSVVPIGAHDEFFRPAACLNII